MQRIFDGPLPDHSRNLLRRAGYGELRKYTGQISYTRRVSNANFPRYHAYVEDKNGGVMVNLHIDQKEATYEGSHAHSGEYDGLLVEREMERIEKAIRGFGKPAPNAAPAQKKKIGWFW